MPWGEIALATTTHYPKDHAIHYHTAMFGLTPEDLENEIGECLTARTMDLPTFRGLGPADMVELQKVSKGKVSSTYHFVTGVDVSSAAAIAAYLTTLTRPLGEDQLWFSRAIGWRVIEGTYCAYNVFSNVDVRVTASFPGGTRMYVVTPEGLTEDVESASPLWSEVYMSAMIRCLLLKDDDLYHMDNTRHEFPFDSAGVKLFLQTFAELYPHGYMVGAGPWVQSASVDCNFMVDALLVLLEATGEYDAAVEMLGKIEAKEVMAEVLLRANQEVNAVSLLVNTARREPRNARVLALEAEFCLSKNKLDLALDCAKRAVAAKPSDFFPWEVLCKVYIALEQWSEALLALNSTPLIPLLPMDVQRLPQSKRVHRPLPEDGVLDEAWQFTSDKRDKATSQLMSVSPQLSRLPAAQLHGSTARAYALLATINAKIGWNELMRLRGEVFWMEAEGDAPIEPKPKDETSEGPKEDKDGAKDGEKVEAQNGAQNGAKDEPKVDEAKDKDETKESDEHVPARRSLRSKRLCERRIDRLFLILYEDVRAYSTWQREAVHFESQQLPFEKSAMEWQIFGSISQRLKHEDQAKRGFARSLALHFNPWALAHEIQYNPLNIEVVVKLMAWDHRWYNEFSPRNMSSLRKLVARDGLTKVRYEIEAAFGKEKVVDLVRIMLNRLAELKVPGFDM